MDPNSGYQPTKTISPVGKGQEHAPGLSVFTACLFVMQGFRVCHNTSMTGLAKNVPDPTSCHDGHYNLSITVPSWIS